MEAVTSVIGTGVPLPRADVDTDQIIPAEWLKRVERTGFGAGLFEAWRRDPEFVLNQERFRSGSILIAGPNFGCGSSREHAPWALEDYGFKAIVASSFADIFRGNSLKLGLLPIVLEQPLVDRLMQAVTDDPTVEIAIDVAEKRIQCAAAGIDADFPLDDSTQHRLLNGLDDIGITLQQGAAIDEYERTRSDWLPNAS